MKQNLSSGARGGGFSFLKKEKDVYCTGQTLLNSPYDYRLTLVCAAQLDPNQAPEAPSSDGTCRNYRYTSGTNDGSSY